MTENRPPPDVTIVICSRNRAPQLSAALSALSRLQSRFTWNAIIVDNASADDTPGVVAEAARSGCPLAYMHVARIGLGAARNAALHAADGTIVAFTDDDCYVDAGFVDAVVQAFREHPAIDCIGGRILPFDPDDARITIDERTTVRTVEPFSFVPAGAFMGANLSFRRRALIDAGGFDPRLGAGTPYPCEDIDAVAAVLWNGGGARFDPGPVVHHHHRRRQKDVAALRRSYTAGRGAYLAKYLLRPESRSAYLRACREQARSVTSRRSLDTLLREMSAGARYMLDGKRYLALVAAAPRTATTLLFATLRVGARAAGRRFGNDVETARPLSR